MTACENMQAGNITFIKLIITHFMLCVKTNVRLNYITVL